MIYLYQLFCDYNFIIWTIERTFQEVATVFLYFICLLLVFRGCFPVVLLTCSLHPLLHQMYQPMGSRNIPGILVCNDCCNKLGG